MKWKLLSFFLKITLFSLSSFRKSESVFRILYAAYQVSSVIWKQSFSVWVYCCEEEPNQRIWPRMTLLSPSPAISSSILRIRLVNISSSSRVLDMIQSLLEHLLLWRIKRGLGCCQVQKMCISVGQMKQGTLSSRLSIVVTFVERLRPKSVQRTLCKSEL